MQPDSITGHRVLHYCEQRSFLKRGAHTESEQNGPWHAARAECLVRNEKVFNLAMRGNPGSRVKKVQILTEPLRNHRQNLDLILNIYFPIRITAESSYNK